MDMIFGVPLPLLLGQLVLGLINGATYAILSLGLAVIFGMLKVINFAHGAQYMLGAFVAWMMASWLGLGFWYALILAPLVVGAGGIVLERVFLRHLYDKDHLFGLLFTFGFALVAEGLFRYHFGSTGQIYSNPIPGGMQLGFMFLPYYRIFIVGIALLICFGTWFVIERTKLGAYLRAATEDPVLVRAFGINVPLLITLTYGFGVALAALAGVIAAPIQNVSPLMGSHIIITVFAVVVIGGLNSIMGAIITGFALGLIEGLAKVFIPEMSNTVVFVIMAIVLLLRPAGLFGQEQ
ncbi:MAG: ABC transporter permease [Hoeflea sp. BRH_c9]|nr:MAG: ABC transporter permease [Hoeflea sp. BRH_c9]